jgi:hypothetical protein
MIPVLRDNIQELPASRALRNLGLYYEQQFSVGAGEKELVEHLNSNMDDIQVHIDSLRGHGFGLAQQHNEKVKTVAVTAISREVVFYGDPSQLAYLSVNAPLVENLALVNFYVGRITLDVQQDDILQTDPHLWYRFRMLGEAGTSHFMNVTSTAFVMPGVFERVN